MHLSLLVAVRIECSLSLEPVSFIPCSVCAVPRRPVHYECFQDLSLYALFSSFINFQFGNTWAECSARTQHQP